MTELLEIYFKLSSYYIDFLCDEEKSLKVFVFKWILLFYYLSI